MGFWCDTYQILFLSGVMLTIGLKSTMQFFMNRQNYKVQLFYQTKCASFLFIYLLSFWPHLCFANGMGRVQFPSVLASFWYLLGGLSWAWFWRHMGLSYYSGLWDFLQSLEPCACIICPQLLTFFFLAVDSGLLWQCFFRGCLLLVGCFNSLSWHQYASLSHVHTQI